MTTTKPLKNLILEEWIERANISKRQITQIAGVSPPYLNLLSNYELQTINRKNLIGIAVGLYLSLKESNELLNHYKQTDLEKDDIKYFIQAGKNRKVSNKVQPLFSDINQLLLLLSVEYSPGKLVITSDQASSILKSEDHIYQYASQKGFQGIELEIYNGIVKERCKAQSKRLSEGDHVEYFISDKNLKSYINQWKRTDSDKKGFNYIAIHFYNLLNHLKKHHNYEFCITDCSHPFLFELKYSQKQGGTLFFLSPNDIKEDNFLDGYTTSDSYIFKQFNREYLQLRSHIIDKYRSYIELKKYIIELFEQAEIDKKNMELLDSVVF